MQSTFPSLRSKWGEVDIGAQRPPGPITALRIELHDEQHAFLNAIEQRAPQGYSVRGNLTAAVANARGGRTVVVRGRPKAVALGCPSFMLNHHPCLGASLQ